MKEPRACASMQEVRQEIDRVDNAIVDLLSERWRFVDRMWQLKKVEAQTASVPWRNREVIERVRARAAAGGMPPEMAEALWRQIIGWGVQYQEERLRTDD
ncbi:MAG: chorismate mutase [Alphaproteobacteria bacterium]|nr:chorismate mutase [Alphaproteobacteria bacterium]